MMDSSFEEIGKAARSLFEGHSLKKALQIKTRTPEGLEVMAQCEAEGRETKGWLESRYSHERLGLALNCLRVDTDCLLHADASIIVDPSLSLRMVARVEESSWHPQQSAGRAVQHSSYGKLALEYANRGVLASCLLDVVNGPTLSVGGVFGAFGGLRLGVGAALNTQLDEVDREPELLEGAVGMHYFGDGWEASLVSRNKFSGLEATFLRKFGTSAQFGAVLNANQITGKGSKSELITGGSYVPYPGSELRVRASSNAILSTTFTQKMNEVVEIGVSAETGAGGGPSMDASTKFGLLLSISG